MPISTQYPYMWSVTGPDVDVQVFFFFFFKAQFTFK